MRLFLPEKGNLLSSDCPMMNLFVEKHVADVSLVKKHVQKTGLLGILKGYEMVFFTSSTLDNSQNM